VYLIVDRWGCKKRVLEGRVRPLYVCE